MLIVNNQKRGDKLRGDARRTYETECPRCRFINPIFSYTFNDISTWSSDSHCNCRAKQSSQGEFPNETELGGATRTNLGRHY